VGNSVLESSRVEGLKRIYMFFGKINPPPEFRRKKYEECLSEIAVTHSPRYMVNMEVGEGETILDKMGTTYDELRGQDNPVRAFLEYYRSNLREGEDLWWLGLGDPESESSSVKIRFWSGLSRNEKKELTCEIMALFPEVLRKGRAGDDKYDRAAAWLLKKKAIVCSSLRDQFTGGGRIELDLGGRRHSGISKLFKRVVVGNVRKVLDCVGDITDEEIELYWGSSIECGQRRERWIRQFKAYGSEWLEGTTLDIEDLLREELGSDYRG
jgi:hypothetical protein